MSQGLEKILEALITCLKIVERDRNPTQREWAKSDKKRARTEHRERAARSRSHARFCARSWETEPVTEQNCCRDHFLENSRNRLWDLFLTPFQFHLVPKTFKNIPKIFWGFENKNWGSYEVIKHGNSTEFTLDRVFEGARQDDWSGFLMVSVL